jgi:hypothetical protein
MREWKTVLQVSQSEAFLLACWRATTDRTRQSRDQNGTSAPAKIPSTTPGRRCANGLMPTGSDWRLSYSTDFNFEPGKHPDSVLRTLQRRVKAWRAAAGKRLVFGGRSTLEHDTSAASVRSPMRRVVAS